jgi:toxin-antitoxin system PIN domain toxin
LIDINVWLALTWDLHPQHAAARRWHESIDDATLLFCRFTMLDFLRLLTNQQVMGDSTVNISGALDLYDQWRRDPRVELTSEPRGTENRFRQALAPHSAAPATKAIADCYLVGFAEATGAQLVTFDKGLSATALARHAPAVLLEPTRREPQVVPRGRGQKTK